MSLSAVHFLDSATWRVARGWLNPSAVSVARPVRLDAHVVLCSECLATVKMPPVLHVRMLDGSAHLVVGDGRTSDSEAVRRLRDLRRARERCEREQHRPFSENG